MSKTIRQSVVLPAPAEKLYDMYLNAKTHSAITGSPVSISSKEGSRFRAFNGMIFGKVLYVVPKRLIVQSWRGNHWKREDPDSIVVLTFLPEGSSGRIDLVHVNVADHDYEGVKEGWDKYYWGPWRDYLEKAEQELKRFRARAA